MPFLVKCLPIVAALSVSASCFSQSEAPLNTVKLLEQGTSLFQDGKYKDAISIYSKIPKNDSNYSLVMFNKALAFYSDSNYVESKRLAEEGLKRFPDKANEWYNLIANNLDNLKQREEAIAMYDKVINQYSNQYISWYNKGLTYYKLEKKEEAKKCLQQCLLINPYYAAAHYFLGIIAYEEGNLVPAYLSFSSSLIMDPENKFSANIIAALSDIAKMKDEVVQKGAQRKSSSTDDFEMIEEILTSKIALDKKYKLKASLEDAIVRQMQVLLEKLEYNANDKGFWMQYYVPFYQGVFKDDQFEQMVFYMFRSVDIKSIQDYVKRNKKKIDVFVSGAAAYFNEIRTTQLLDVAARKNASIKVLYDDDSKALGKGKIVVEGNKSMLVGPWEFYYENGQLKSKGELNDKQEKIGEWTFYFANGQLKEKSSFSGNIAEGKSISYFDNGLENIEDVYKKGEVDGVRKEHFYNGLIYTIENYVNGQKQGAVKGYSSNNTLEYVGNYKDGKEDGLFEYYYANGKVKSKVFFKEGESTGDYKYYYVDGTLNWEGKFDAGKRVGVWNEYYNNGKLKSVTSYVNGELDGEHKEFYDNGTLMVKTQYVKDKLEGKYEDYDWDGKVYSESLYEKGRLRELKYFNKEGAVISNTTSRNGGGNLVFFDAAGNKIGEGNFSKDGVRNGKSVSYYRNGKTRTVAQYKDGLQNGERLEYYFDGTLFSKVNYKDDEEDGYKVTYFPNGSKKSETFLVNGVLQGSSKSYNSLGNLISEANYKDGELNGILTYYHPNGKVDMENDYVNGWMVASRHYDTLGKLITNIEFPKGDATYELKNYAGKTMVKAAYKHNYLNGPHTIFYPDGSPYVVQHYKYGIKDSTVKKYYFGGQLEYEGNIQMGQNHGKWTFYHENGKLFYTETYNHGRLNGVTKLYYDNGELEKEIGYNEGEMNGEYKMYGDANQLAVILNYRNGYLLSYTYEGKDGKLVPAIPLKNGTGAVVAYYKNGSKSVEFTFDDDEINGVRKLYYSNGKTAFEGKRVMGDDHGQKKIYYNNGEIKREENYQYGNLHGVVKKYYENGKLKSEEHYYDGEKHGIAKYYDSNGKLQQTRNYYYDHLQEVK